MVEQFCIAAGKVYSLLYIVGIMAGFSILGPALGFIMGGSLLNIYVDHPKPPPE